MHWVSGVRWHLGSNSSTFYEQLLCSKILKTPKRQSSCQSFFMILGSACAKAAHRTLMKLALCFGVTVFSRLALAMLWKQHIYVRTTNLWVILCQTDATKHLFLIISNIFLTLHFGFVTFWRQNIGKKCAHKMLMKSIWDEWDREHWTGEVLADEWLPVFLFLIGHWYYEKKIVFIKWPILAGTHS